MNGFNRRAFVNMLGRCSAILGLRLASRKARAKESVPRVSSKKLETDLVVVGAGPSGLSATLREAELGLKVRVFEEASTTGGTRNGGMGPFGAGAHIQAKYGIKNCTTKDAFNDFMDFNHWKTDARLASESINSTAFTIKWLENEGFVSAP